MIESQQKNNRKNATSKFHISTFNARTMSTDTHLTNFSMALKKIKYDVVGLSEVKREDEEIIQRSDFILYTITKTRRRGSVGIAVNSKWKNNIESFLSYSDRVCLINLLFDEGSMTIIQVYAPTSQASDDEMMTFYLG